MVLFELRDFFFLRERNNSAFDTILTSNQTRIWSNTQKPIAEVELVNFLFCFFCLPHLFFHFSQQNWKIVWISCWKKKKYYSFGYIF